jgi:hypothetical protein
MEMGGVIIQSEDASTPVAISDPCLRRIAALRSCHFHNSGLR